MAKATNYQNSKKDISKNVKQINVKQYDPKLLPRQNFNQTM